MKSYRKELWFNVPTRRAFRNITPQVEACLRESGIQEGLLLAKVKGSTCGALSVRNCAVPPRAITADEWNTVD